MIDRDADYWVVLEPVDERSGLIAAARRPDGLQGISHVLHSFCEQYSADHLTYVHPVTDRIRLESSPGQGRGLGPGWPSHKHSKILRSAKLNLN